LPSPLKSAAQIPNEDEPDANSVIAENVGVDAPGVVVFKVTAMLLTVPTDDARSGLPSKLKSAEHIPATPLFDAVRVVTDDNVGVVAPGVVVLSIIFSVCPKVENAKSGFPSKLKSAEHNLNG
jgi:hypothetical protein